MPMWLGRDRSRLTPWISGLAVLALLLDWGPAARIRVDQGVADTERVRRGAEGVGRRNPAADPMLARLLGWGTGAVVVTAAVWIVAQTWMTRQEADAVARAITGGEPSHAAALVTRYGCGGCHTVSGLPGADGQVGPPLTGLRARVFIAGVLPNTADNLVRWIVTPRRFSPGSAMPTTGIGPEEARDVAAYLYAH
jgi:cytochrome c2